MRQIVGAVVACWTDLTNSVACDSINDRCVWCADRHSSMAQVAFLAKIVIDVIHSCVRTVVALVALEAGCLVERWVECTSRARVLSRCSSHRDIALDYWPVVALEIAASRHNEF